MNNMSGKMPSAPRRRRHWWQYIGLVLSSLLLACAALAAITV
jgi:hypothetical protein